jgi:glycine/D-amino acid oxidase-like deaminating enzyme
MADSEIVVIGGGIAGASAACHLAEHGRSVILLERGEIASEASGVNAGAIGAMGWGNLPDLQSYLTMGSLQIFKALQLDHGYDIEFRASGALQAIHTTEQYSFARDQALSLKSRGYCVELLTARDARGIEPAFNPELLGALHYPLRAQADPQKATRAFAAAAVEHGAEVLTGREVTGIAKLPGGGHRVTCSGEVYNAGRLVLAAGAWCGPLGEMLGIRIPIVPVRGQMWATAPTSVSDTVVY